MEGQDGRYEQSLRAAEQSWLEPPTPDLTDEEIWKIAEDREIDLE